MNRRIGKPRTATKINGGKGLVIHSKDVHFPTFENRVKFTYDGRDAYLIYSGQRGPLTTAQWGRMIKSWCTDAGLEGQFVSHTARKSFVRIQHDEFKTSLTTLMVILNHSTPTQTLTYMGRMADDVTKAYSHSI